MDLKKKESFELSPESSLNLETKFPIYSDKKIRPGKEIIREFEGISNLNDGADHSKFKASKNDTHQQRKKKFLSYRKKSESLEVKKTYEAKKKFGLTVRKFFF